jgi:hypothetical protein
MTDTDKQKAAIDAAITHLTNALVETRTSANELGVYFDSSYYVDLSKVNLRQAIKQLKIKRARL